MNWEGKRVFVTGGGGFIGSHLIDKLLSLGAEVTVMLRYTSMKNQGNLPLFVDTSSDKLNIVYGDIIDQKFVEHHIKDQEAVFHLAALIGIPYSYVAPISYVNTNIIGTVNILEAVKSFDVEIALFTSTSEVYGTAQYTPIDEKHPLQGQSPYSATKIGADKLVESYHLSFDLPVGIVRPFNTFGPGQSTRAVIPTIITQALSGKDEIELGDTSTTRDYIYVKDTANGYIKISENPRFDTPINLATGISNSIGEIANMIIDKTGVDAQITVDPERIRPEKSEVRELNGDASLARQLGWVPNFTFSQGLDETIAWFDENMNKYERFVGKYER